MQTVQQAKQLLLEVDNNQFNCISTYHYPKLYMDTWGTTRMRAKGIRGTAKPLGYSDKNFQSSFKEKKKEKWLNLPVGNLRPENQRSTSQQTE